MKEIGKAILRLLLSAAIFAVPLALVAFVLSYFGTTVGGWMWYVVVFATVGWRLGSQFKQIRERKQEMVDQGKLRQYYIIFGLFAVYTPAFIALITGLGHWIAQFSAQGSAIAMVIGLVVGLFVPAISFSED